MHTHTHTSRNNTKEVIEVVFFFFFFLFIFTISIITHNDRHSFACALNFFIFSGGEKILYTYTQQRETIERKKERARTRYNFCLFTENSRTLSISNSQSLLRMRTVTVCPSMVWSRNLCTLASRFFFFFFERRFKARSGRETKKRGQEQHHKEEEDTKRDN